MPDNHRYVPQWYQRKFLQNEIGEFFVLDKTPANKKLCPDGVIRTIKPYIKIILRDAAPVIQFKEK